MSMFKWLSSSEENDESSAEGKDIEDTNITSMWNMIKEKSSVAVKIISDDLKEFSQTVTTDTTAFVSDNLSPLLTTTNEGVGDVQESSSTITADTTTTTTETNSSLKSLEATLTTLDSSYSVNKHDPVRIEEVLRMVVAQDGSMNDQEYNNWFKSFVLENYKDDITRTLEKSTHVSEIFDSTVPAMMKEEVFWSRYYYYTNEFTTQGTTPPAFGKGGAEGGDDEILEWDDICDLDADLDMIDNDLINDVVKDSKLSTTTTSVSSSASAVVTEEVKEVVQEKIEKNVSTLVAVKEEETEVEGVGVEVVKEKEGTSDGENLLDDDWAEIDEWK
jgi:hypothetical protein